MKKKEQTVAGDKRSVVEKRYSELMLTWVQ